VKWKNPPWFAAEKFLGPFAKAASLEPEVLRKPPDKWGKARAHVKSNNPHLTGGELKF